jgi:ATP-binding cassette subfamily G (WHITE) protein 2 (SNQ2)
MMTDVFTWRNLKYDVSLKKGETRRLLDDISGFVAPGKLTALMGESGAGKVRESRIYAEESRANIYLSRLRC